MRGSWLRGRELIAGLLVGGQTRGGALSQISLVVRFCSLIPCSWFFGSLFSKIFSLISFAGNWVRNGCSTAVSCSETRSSGSEIGKIPDKFPVSRESAWRRVRSALRRQPATPAFRRPPQEKRKWAGNAGFSRVRLRLQTPKSAIAGRQSAKVSDHTREYSRFAETVGGDRVRS
jgi:hypothetical protein